MELTIVRLECSNSSTQLYSTLLYSTVPYLISTQLNRLDTNESEIRQRDLQTRPTMEGWSRETEESTQVEGGTMGDKLVWSTKSGLRRTINSNKRILDGHSQQIKQDNTTTMKSKKAITY